MRNPKSGCYEYRCAYRYSTGEVEGFVGISLQGEAGARQDAINQIGRKMVHINQTRRYRKLSEEAYGKVQLITSVKDLTPADKAIIEADWNTGVRY